uniref:Uncharacterized protein n=1 Tax=Panagrolaimus davidi TaxID=227884 RepID=A0A914Q5T2_9BILA
MDLTVALNENPPSNSENNGAENDGMIVRNSMRAKFMETYYHQNFSMPDSLIFYITTNPKTAELYLKMVKTCKYFFVKNPILVIDKALNYDDSQWSIMQTPCRRTGMKQTTSKLWIANGLIVSQKYSDTTETIDENILNSIIPKLYRCDLYVLSLFKQIISYRDLPLLISSAKSVFFDEVVVKHEDGSNVEVQKIVEIASKATSIDISRPTITSKTMEELLKIPHFFTLPDLTLKNVPEVFDIKAFYVYMKKNKTTEFILYFDESISDDYKKRLLEITDEIIAKKKVDYIPPMLRFRGLDLERRMKLDAIFWKKP